MPLRYIKILYYILSIVLFLYSLLLPAVADFNGYTVFMLGIVTIILNTLLFVFWLSNVLIFMSFLYIEIGKYRRSVICSLLGIILATVFYFVWPYIEESNVRNPGLHIGYWVWLLSFFVFFCGSLHIYLVKRKWNKIDEYYYL